MSSFHNLKFQTLQKHRAGACPHGGGNIHEYDRNRFDRKLEIYPSPYTYRWDPTYSKRGVSKTFLTTFKFFFSENELLEDTDPSKNYRDRQNHSALFHEIALPSPKGWCGHEREAKRETFDEKACSSLDSGNLRESTGEEALFKCTYMPKGFEKSRSIGFPQLCSLHNRKEAEKLIKFLQFFHSAKAREDALARKMKTFEWLSALNQEPYYRNGAVPHDRRAAFLSRPYGYTQNKGNLCAIPDCNLLAALDNGENYGFDALLFSKVLSGNFTAASEQHGLKQLTRFPDRYYRRNFSDSKRYFA